MISSVPTRYYKPPQPEGTAVSWHFTIDHGKAENEIAAYICHMMDNGVTPVNIVILSKNKPGEAIQTELERLNIPYRLPKGAEWDENIGIRLSTIHRFKGLEARYIIIYGLEDLSEYNRWLLYVGMSRAILSLDVWLIEDCREAYSSMLLRRLSGYEK